MAMVREKSGRVADALKLYRTDKFLVNNIVASRPRCSTRCGTICSSVPRRIRSHGAVVLDKFSSDPAYAGRIDGLEARPARAPGAFRSRATHRVDRGLHECSAGARTSSTAPVMRGCSSAAARRLRRRRFAREMNQDCRRASEFYSDQRSDISLRLRSGQGLGHGKLISLIESTSEKT